ncbi:MAG: ATP-binding protein [Armatimonadota bacterium]
MSIAIFDDRLEISSSGILPFDLTTDDLTKPHASQPWNPLIAQAFYRRGIIETWGRGTIKIQELTSSAGLAPPEFSCQMGEVMVKFYSAQLESDDVPLQEKVVALLKSGPMSKSEISTRLGQKQVSGQLHHVIRLLLRSGLIEMTIPGKPQSRLQRYTLRSAGEDTRERKH